MASGGFRTLKKGLGRGFAQIAPRRNDTEGLRALLKELIRDLADLQTHTHRYDGSSAGVAQSTGPQSTAAGVAAGGTAITFGAYTVE